MKLQKIIVTFKDNTEGIWKRAEGHDFYYEADNGFFKISQRFPGHAPFDDIMISSSEIKWVKFEYK